MLVTPDTKKMGEKYYQRILTLFPQNLEVSMRRTTARRRGLPGIRAV
jgi:hypothetical protein